MRDIQVFLRFANSRIAAPLTSMLKTSCTESAEPRKGLVGVGGSGRNRVELVGKHESDGVEGGVGRSGDFNMAFQVIRWHSRHCSSKRMVAFDHVSEVDNEKPIPVTLD